MCADPGDLRRRAGWDGASGTSRRQLLDALHGRPDHADSFGGGLFLTIGCGRLYSFRYHDTTTAVFNTSPSSEAVSTTTLRLS